MVRIDNLHKAHIHPRRETRMVLQCGAPFGHGRGSRILHQHDRMRIAHAQ